MARRVSALFTLFILLSLVLVLLSGMTLDDDMIRLSKNAGFDHCVDKSAGPKAIDALLRQ